MTKKHSFDLQFSLATIENYNQMLKVMEIMFNPNNAANPNIDLGKMKREVAQQSARGDYILVR